jgi:hypothetical protein
MNSLCGPSANYVRQTNNIDQYVYKYVYMCVCMYIYICIYIDSISEIHDTRSLARCIHKNKEQLLYLMTSACAGCLCAKNTHLKDC